MENWKKIRSYSRSYEAELRKEILNNNNIDSVVLAAQDSSFLIGDFDLYVEEQNFEPASIILEEYKGWTKVNSFPLLKPVEIVKTHLETQGLEVFFTKNNHLNEYEVFVKNEEADKALDLINSMKPWVLLDSFETTRQAAFRVEQLDIYEIDSVIIKRRATDRHLLKVDIMVNPTKYKTAVDVINEMKGWHFVEEYKDKKKAQLTQKMLEEKGILVLTKFVNCKENEEKVKKVELFTKYENIKQAKTTISESREWVKFASFNKLYQVDMIREILKQNDISSVFINSKGSMFLLGEMHVYVEKDDLQRAKAYLKSWNEALKPIDIEE